jgi:hypothetical protein
MLRLDCAETAALPQLNTLQNRGAFQRLDSSTYFATSTGIIHLHEVRAHRFPRLRRRLEVTHVGRATLTGNWIEMFISHDDLHRTLHDSLQTRPATKRTPK